jgi:glycosyltransferase involved in cell wall biosynthesis
VTPSSDISVIIPYYNREQFIDETIQSVLAQTLQPLEIIIVNDCSRESSRRHLDRYEGVCRILDLKENIGLAGARNAGIEAAKGRYMAFLDDDDIWMPNKLEVQLKYLQEHPECGIVHTAVLYFFQDGKEEYVRQFYFPCGPMWLASALTNGSWAVIPSILAHSDVVRAVDGFDVKFREVEDRDFIIRVCAAGYQVELIEEALIRVRRQEQEGLTKSHWRIYKADLRMCWKHRAHYLQAYGVWGVMSFLIEKAQAPSRKTPALDKLMLFLLWFVKYRIKTGYEDPVLCKPEKPALLVQQLSERAQVLKKEFREAPIESRNKRDVSVVITFYNRERYIDYAVQSVLAQTLKPLEIIIVNNCSSEFARRSLDRYADVCRIIDLPKNVGPAGARNAGIEAARGAFVALLDDDDTWMPEKLELQRKYIGEHPQCALVHSSVCTFFSNTADFVFANFDSGPMPLAQALRDDYWAVPSSMMFRTEAIRVIGGFDVKYVEGGDRDFLIRCCAAGYNVEGLRETLIRLRRTSHGCLSEHRWKTFSTQARIAWKHKTLYQRAYGVRGAMTFLLGKFHVASSTTPFVNSFCQFLIKVFGRKWILRPAYRDPVQFRQPDSQTAREAPVLVASERRS